MWRCAPKDCFSDYDIAGAGRLRVVNWGLGAVWSKAVDTLVLLISPIARNLLLHRATSGFWLQTPQQRLVSVVSISYQPSALKLHLIWSNFTHKYLALE